MPHDNLPTVFVVDDEPVITSTLVMILNTLGFQALGFTSPLAALQSANLMRPSLLISDVTMPDLNGVDLAIKVRARWPDCRVILFSGQANTSPLLETAREQGHHFQVMNKPIHPTELVAAIKKPEL